jgi:phosphocarrier protein
MVSKELTIVNPMGMHMRPANEFVKLATSFPCDIKILASGKTLNGKSIMNVMAAGLKKGATFTLQCTGEKESEALEAIGAFVESGLGE